MENIMRGFISDGLETLKLSSFKCVYKAHKFLCPALRKYSDVYLDLNRAFTNFK